MSCHYSSECGNHFEAMFDGNHIVECDVHENDLAGSFEEKEGHTWYETSQPGQTHSGVTKIGYCWSHSLQEQRSESNGCTASLLFNEVQTMSRNIINQDSPLIVPLLHPAVTQIVTRIHTMNSDQNIATRTSAIGQFHSNCWRQYMQLG